MFFIQWNMLWIHQQSKVLSWWPEHRRSLTVVNNDQCAYSLGPDYT